ncbi:MAG: HU family DNA-binding protein [Alphaproteobacteria bacterium]|nr:HU family DNA-binding protein [Alphaproteobacteria bacterium]
MNKKELAAKLAKKTGLSQVKAMECVNAIFDANPGHGIIAVELDAGRKVVIPGFGTFAAKRRAARVGTNPASGSKISIPAKSYVHFKPGKTLRERIED